MRSAFPGMDPWIEHPSIWPGVHQRLITYAGDLLQASVGPAYFVAIGERVYVESPASETFHPDVSVVRRHGPADRAEGSGSLVEADQPTVLVVEPIERREVFLEIHDAATQAKIVTVIEVLSPSNKRLGQGRELYLNKQQEVLASSASLVEIDLLRGGEPTVASGSRTRSSCGIACRGSRCRCWQPTLRSCSTCRVCSTRPTRTAATAGASTTRSRRCRRSPRLSWPGPASASPARSADRSAVHAALRSRADRRTGCALLASPDILEARGLSDPSGVLRFTFCIPDQLGLAGVRFFRQLVGLAPGLNPAGLIVSDAGAATIGARWGVAANQAMKASERARRFREPDRAEAARGGIGIEFGRLVGMAYGATLAFVVAQLAAPDSQHSCHHRGSTSPHITAPSPTPRRSAIASGPSRSSRRHRTQRR